MSHRLTDGEARPPFGQSRWIMGGMRYTSGSREQFSQAKPHDQPGSERYQRARLLPRDVPRSLPPSSHSGSRTEASRSDVPVHVHQNQNVVTRLRSSGSRSAESHTLNHTDSRSERLSAASNRSHPQPHPSRDEKSFASDLGHVSGRGGPKISTVIQLPRYEQTAEGSFVRRPNKQPINNNIMNQSQSITNVHHDHNYGEHASAAERPQTDDAATASISLNQLQMSLRNIADEENRQSAADEPQDNLGGKHDETVYQWGNEMNIVSPDGAESHHEHDHQQGVRISPMYTQGLHQVETSNQDSGSIEPVEDVLEDTDNVHTRHFNDVSQIEEDTPHPQADHEHEADLPVDEDGEYGQDEDAYNDHGDGPAGYGYNYTGDHYHEYDTQGDYYEEHEHE